MGVRWDLSLRYRGTYTASPICPGRQYGFNTVYRLEASPPEADSLLEVGIDPEPG